MNKLSLQSGFSAVELLITLFVAFLFVMMGYQLYGAVINDGGEVRSDAKASDIAYKYLRQYADGAPAVCAASTPKNNVALATSEMQNAKITVTITCPNTSLTGLSLVTSKVTYGSPQQEVTHALYMGQ